MNQGNKPQTGKHQAPEPGKKEKRKKRTGKELILHRVYITLVAVSAVIVGGYIGWDLFSAPPAPKDQEYTRPPQYTTVIDEKGNVIKVEKENLSTDRKREFYTFLLVGQDTYGGGNTDTMMLAAYDVPNQVLKVMSLPRDTYVRYNDRRVLLNSVYNRAGGGDKGIAALKQEVGKITGVVPDYHVIVQWEAVGNLVDAIDGVEFDVPRRMYYNDLSQDFKIDLQPGLQHMDGSKAMQLVRWRHNSDDSGHILNSGYVTGDLGRIKTQQDFLKAVIKKCLQLDVLLTNLGEYIDIFQKNVVTDLSVSNLAYFGKSAIGGLNIDDVSFLTMPYQDAGDGAHVLPMGSKIVEEVNSGFNPYLADILLGELDLVEKQPKPAATGTPSAAVKPAPTPTPAVSTENTPSPSRLPEEGEIPPQTSPTLPSAEGEETAQPSGAPLPTGTVPPAAAPEPTAAETPPGGIPIYTPKPDQPVGVLPAMPTPVRP